MENYCLKNKVWDFFIQTCIGVQYLHARKILHRDLKTINLFLYKDGRLKIGDLGVAKEVLESHTETIVGTPYYLSPELCEEKPYNNKSDIWSLGWILYELCTWKHPFDAKTQGGLFLKIIKGVYEPIPDCYSKDLSEIIDKWLQKNCKDRPSIQQILENEKLIELATELNHVVPTEDEVNDLINGQRTDFMTTFMKKKNPNKGASAGSGSVGLISRDKLKNKHYSPIVKTTHVAKPGAKLSPSEPIQKKNISIDINEISDDAIKAIDKISGEKSVNKNKARVPDYSKKPFSAKKSGRKSARKLTPNLDDKDNYASNPKKVPASKAVPKATLNVDDSDKGPLSSQKQKRDITKPWRRPKTARVKAEEIKKASKDEHIDIKKEGTRRKASDIIDSRRKQTWPVITKPVDYEHEEEKKKSEDILIKKTKTHEKPLLDKSQKPLKADRINIGLLEDELEENPQALPLPYVQITSKSINPKRELQMKKTKSAIVDSLLIPLNRIEEDFSQRNFKEGDMNPVVLSKTKSSPLKIGGGNASRMIGDIKKKMKYKGAKSLENNEQEFVDETNGIQVINGDDDILTSGNVDEVENIKYTYVTNEEEDKLDKYNLSNRSRTSLSTNGIPITEDGEGEGEYDFFDYNDKNFFEDFDLTKTPFLDYGLDQIDENDELENYDDDDDEEENEIASLKRRIKDLTQERKEKWRDLRTSSEYEKCKMWYNYFTLVMTDIEDIDDQEKMEDVHIFIKKQNVENYTELVFNLFKLFNDDKELEAKQLELRKLESN
jgi:serine/threonine protein kinase